MFDFKRKIRVKACSNSIHNCEVFSRKMMLLSPLLSQRVKSGTSMRNSKERVSHQRKIQFEEEKLVLPACGSAWGRER